MTKINSKKMEEFAKIYDNRKELYRGRWGESKDREKVLEERIERELGGPTIFYSDFKELIREYEALTNRNRIRALEYLTLKNKATQTEVAGHLGTSIPTARKHLEILENAGMISSTIEKTGTGKQRIYVAERKLVKRGEKEEVLKKRILELDSKTSLVHNVTKKAILEIAKSKEFRKYIRKTGFDKEWKIADSLQEIITKASDAVILEPYPQVHPIEEDNNFYEYDTNFEILAACGRFDLIDVEVEEKSRFYADFAVFRDLPRDEVLTNIRKHLEHIERIKEELREKYGVEDDY